MDQNTIGKLLPNLKVTLGNDSDSDNQIEDGEISDTIDDSENIFAESDGEKKVDVVRSWMKTLKNPKVYENKAGGFITGLDLSSEVLIKKLQERAQRFGLEKKEQITQNEIDALYESLGIEPGNLASCKLKNIRLDAIHLRGVEEMNMNDIFDYFKDYGAASIEWINDFSCNVLYLDPATTARAMIGMSRPLIIKKKGTIKQEITESSTKEGEVKSSETADIIEMSDSEDDIKVEEAGENCMEVDSLPDTEELDKPEIKNNLSEEPTEIVDVPVPPGYWRLGVPYPKSKALLMRFATRDDKKLPGAEKRSLYYQIHGNPNFGGLKGIISSSRKRKMQAARNRQVVEKFTEDSKSELEISAGESSKRTIIKANRTKMPRMRMYADDEEEKKRKGSSIRHEPRRPSVHSRLGTKYTKDDLLQLGNRFSSESEEEDDNVPIHCTLPPKYNVWTNLAKKMAEEDNPRIQSISSRIEPFNVGRSRNYRANQDRSFTRYRRSPESIQGSRSWRTSSQDLRSSLNSQRRVSPLNRPQEDLRSKIKRIKKEDGVQKHRSPMFMDD